MREKKLKGQLNFMEFDKWHYLLNTHRFLAHQSPMHKLAILWIFFFDFIVIVVVVVLNFSYFHFLLLTPESWGNFRPKSKFQ